METLPAENGSRASRFPARGPLMNCCECSGVSFREIREHMRADGLSVPDACRRTGCGQLCTACLPDLEAYLSAGA